MTSGSTKGVDNVIIEAFLREMGTVPDAGKVMSKFYHEKVEKQEKVTDKLKFFKEKRFKAGTTTIKNMTNMINRHYPNPQEESAKEKRGDLGLGVAMDRKIQEIMSKHQHVTKKPLST